MLLLSSLALACTTTTPLSEAPARPVRAVEVPRELIHEPLPLAQVSVTPEPITVEDAFVLDLYTFFHRQDYGSFRVEYPAHGGGTAIAHLLVPPGPGPHKTVMVFDILAGDHVVGEAMAKALVRRGYLAARLERAPLELDKTDRAETPAETLRSTVLDARRLLDYLESRPDVDRTRIASAGVSLGAILACLLHGTDPRIRAGFYLMPGGDIPAILSDSTEVPVQVFRDKIIEVEKLDGPAAFGARMRPLLEVLEPLRYAPAIDPRTVLFVSSRFDRVIRPVHAEALWKALGQPRWIKLPSGHYQILPFFWSSIAKGADHMDGVLGAPESRVARETSR